MWVGFLYKEASNVLSDPGVINMFKSRMDPLLLDTAAVNCM